MNREEVRDRTIRDLAWLIRCAEDYRRGLEGKPCQHSLQDIELVVKEMRERLDRLSASSSIRVVHGDRHGLTGHGVAPAVGIGALGAQEADGREALSVGPGNRHDRDGSVQLADDLGADHGSPDWMTSKKPSGSKEVRDD